MHLYFGYDDDSEIDYARQFPGITVAPVRQSPLDDPGDTLQITLFEQIIAALSAQV